MRSRCLEDVGCVFDRFGHGTYTNTNTNTNTKTKHYFSIGGTHVKNITFRDIYMPHTYKGIYMKFREDGGDGLVEDITYENIWIESPEQWPIWIGPAQQSDSNNPCAAHPCSLCWPDVPFAKCDPDASKYLNILLKNVTINNADYSPGVILANSTNPGERAKRSSFEEDENASHC